MLYKVTMKYFDGDGDCYGIMEGKFPSFNLAWKMVNLVKAPKLYKMILTKEDEYNEYYTRTHVTYTTCDGARRALKRSGLVRDGNRRLVLTAQWDYDDSDEETHVLIIIEKVEDVEF